ncbi:MAG: pitrilysin family protein, partial [bacterium]
MRRRILISAAAFLAAALLAGAGAARAASILTYEREELPGGGVLIVKEAHQLPMVTVRVAIPAGSRYEPPGKAGLGNMVAATVIRGAAGRSALDIEKMNDRLGGGVGVDAGRLTATASLRTLTRDIEEGMDLLADILRRPSFPEKEIEKTRRRILGGLKRRKDRPGHLADEAFRKRLFGDHPQGRLPVGSPETVKGVTRGDLAAFHRKWYGMKGSIFAFVGDITLARARELVLARFRDWKAEGGEPPAAAMPPAPEGLVVEKVDRPLSQTT